MSGSRWHRWHTEVCVCGCGLDLTGFQNLSGLGQRPHGTNGTFGVPRQVGAGSVTRYPGRRGRLFPERGMAMPCPYRARLKVLPPARVRLVERGRYGEVATALWHIQWVYVGQTGSAGPMASRATGPVSPTKGWACTCVLNVRYAAVQQSRVIGRQAIAFDSRLLGFRVRDFASVVALQPATRQAGIQRGR